MPAQRVKVGDAAFELIDRRIFLRFGQQVFLVPRSVANRLTTWLQAHNKPLVGPRPKKRASDG